MKSNQRTVKVYDTTHATLAKLSDKFNISQAAIVDIAVQHIARQDVLTIKPSNRGAKRNAATAVKKTSRKEIMQEGGRG